MNIEDRLKQDAARFRDIKPPDNLRALLHASLENAQAPDPRPQTRKIMGWFHPAVTFASLLLVIVLVTAVFPLQQPVQPDPGGTGILGIPGASPGVALVPWLALPGLAALGALLHAVRRRILQPRIAAALLFIITLLALLLLMYNLVPSLKYELFSLLPLAELLLA